MVHHEIFHEPDQHWKVSEPSKSASVCPTHKRIKSGSLKDSRDTSDCICPELWSSQKDWQPERCFHRMKALQKTIKQHYEISVSKNHHSWISQDQEFFWCCDQSSNRRKTDRDEITAFWNQWSCCNHEECRICDDSISINRMKHMKNASDSRVMNWCFCRSQCESDTLNCHECHDSRECEYSLRCNIDSRCCICNESCVMVAKYLKSYSIIFFFYVNKLSRCHRQARLANHCTIPQCECSWLSHCIWWELTRWKISLSFSPYIKHNPEFLQHSEWLTIFCWFTMTCMNFWCWCKCCFHAICMTKRNNCSWCNTFFIHTICNTGCFNPSK